MLIHFEPSILKKKKKKRWTSNMKTRSKPLKIKKQKLEKMRPLRFQIFFQKDEQSQVGQRQGKSICTYT